MDSSFSFYKLFSKEIDDMILRQASQQRKFCALVIYEEHTSPIYKPWCPQAKGHNGRQCLSFEDYLFLPQLTSST